MVRVVVAADESADVLAQVVKLTRGARDECEEYSECRVFECGAVGERRCRWLLLLMVVVVVDGDDLDFEADVAR